MNFYLRTPQDGTLYGGMLDSGAHVWTITKRLAKAYPSHMQATLAMQALERAYAGVGFYTTEIVTENDLA